MIGCRLGGGVEMTERSRAHLRQLLLGRHAELLLLVDNKQSQVVEFHLLAQDLVRTDQDVDATLGQLR